MIYSFVQVNFLLLLLLLMVYFFVLSNFVLLFLFFVTMLIRLTCKHILRYSIWNVRFRRHEMIYNTSFYLTLSLHELSNVRSIFLFIHFLDAFLFFLISYPFSPIYTLLVCCTIHFCSLNFLSFHFHSKNDILFCQRSFLLKLLFFVWIWWQYLK